MKSELHYRTPEGYTELQELKDLKETRLSEVAQRLYTLRQEGGDFYDNSEYLDAKREYDLIRNKIVRITDILDRVRTIETKRNQGRVRLGCRVTIIEKGTQQEEVYLLVDSAEANPREGKISDQSPLGRALIGAQVGDSIEVNAPDSKIVFMIKRVE